MLDINPNTKKPVLVQGSVFFLTGTTGTGKTTFIKNNLKKIPLPKKIFDVDSEYNEFNSIKPNRQIGLEKSAEVFKKMICQEWERAMVFSEAGLFFKHGGGSDLEMREILKGARRRGNFVFFDFHSLSEVPVDMLKYCNFLVIKKTVMETKQQLSKFSAYPEIMQKYKKVMQGKTDFETEIIIPRNLQVQL